MSKLHVSILLIATALIFACAGWFAARTHVSVINSEIVIAGQQQIAVPPGVNYPQEPSPKTVIAKCAIRNSKITTATENGEYARVRIGDLSPEQLKCLLEQGQQSIAGDAPQRPFSIPPRRSYQPLYITLESPAK